jgi:hypothetical protein
VALTVLNMWVFESYHLDIPIESYALFNFQFEAIVEIAYFLFNRKSLIHVKPIEINLGLQNFSQASFL